MFAELTVYRGENIHVSRQTCFVFGFFLYFFFESIYFLGAFGFIDRTVEVMTGNRLKEREE